MTNKSDPPRYATIYRSNGLLASKYGTAHPYPTNFVLSCGKERKYPLEANKKCVSVLNLDCPPGLKSEKDESAHTVSLVFCLTVQLPS